MWRGRAGTCEGVSGTGIFFSTRLTLAGSLSSSLSMFLWGQPTWETGRLSWGFCSNLTTLPSLSECPARSHGRHTTFRESLGTPLTVEGQACDQVRSHPSAVTMRPSCVGSCHERQLPQPWSSQGTKPSGDFPSPANNRPQCPSPPACPFSVTHHHLLIDLNNLVSWQDLGAGGSLV